MEGGIEAGDLRQRRRALYQDPDRRQVMRLVQRRQGNQALELRHHIPIYAHRCRVVDAAVHHTVSDGGQLVLGGVGLLQPVPDMGDRAVVPELGALCPALLARRLAGSARGDEMGARVDAFDLAACHDRRLDAGRREQRELDAGRAGVQDKDRISHSVPFTLSYAWKQAAGSCDHLGYILTSRRRDQRRHGAGGETRHQRLGPPWSCTPILRIIRSAKNPVK